MLDSVLYSNHRQYFTFFLYLKKRSRIVIRKSNEHQIWFLKILSLLSRRWNGLLCSQKANNLLNREDNFFCSKRVVLGIKKSVFLRRFQICKLTLVTKRPLKTAIQNNRIFEGLCHFSAQKSIILDQLVLGAFCH